MKFLIDDDKLEIVLEGKERVFALRRTLSVPIATITNVEWAASTVNTWRLSGLRAPGTGVPGIFYAGSFFRKSGWEFWYLRVRQPGHIIITTNMKRYHVLRISVNQEEGLKIREWFSKHLKVGNIA